MHHQMALALETLKRDGFPVWKIKGYEADDLIAAGVAQALAIEGTTVLVVSSDKDLLALVSDRVHAKSLTNGNRLGPDDVFAKLKVRPDQVCDYLSLVGDTSDNIVGAKGVGGVTAAKLLTEHGSIQAIYDKMAVGVVPGLTPSIRASFTEFKDRWPTVRSLITLRTDAPIEFSEIAAERVPTPMEETADMSSELNAHLSDPETVSMAEAQKPRVPFEKGNDANDAPLFSDVDIAKTDTRIAVAAQGKQEGAMPSSAPHIVKTADDIAAATDKARNAQSAQLVPYVAPAAPVDFSQQLEPRTMPEAKQLAQLMYDSRLFSAYGTPQAVLAVVMAGRELGLQAMASLRAFHVIENKPRLTADTMAALVMRSDKCKYFRCTERTPLRSTFVTQRLPVEDYPEQVVSVTIEEMRAAWKSDEKAWNASSWGKNPASMLVAAAKRTLARLEYPDIVGNIYTEDE